MQEVKIWLQAFSEVTFLKVILPVALGISIVVHHFEQSD
jgi:hypothetical protein